MQRKEHLLDVVRVLYKWKIFIFIVCLIAAIGSIILALSKDNYYQSSTLFYATNHDLSKPNPIGNTGKTTYYYGSSEDMDRLMTLSESDLLADFLIDSFQLYQHYGIDTSDVKKNFRVMEIFRSQYKVLKTKHDAIEVLVEDIDPAMAVKIADAARIKINLLAQEMIRKSQKQRMAMMEMNIRSRAVKLDSVEKALVINRNKYGIFNPATQSRDLPELLLLKRGKLNEEKGRLEELKKHSSVPRDTIIFSTARIKGLEKQVTDLKRQVALFTEGFSDYEVLYRVHQIQKDEMAFEGQRLKQLQAAYNSEFTALHVIEKATIPRDKSRPKRSIIIIISVLLAFVLSCIAALITDTYKSINWQEVLNG